MFDTEFFDSGADRSETLIESGSGDDQPNVTPIESIDIIDGR